MRYWKRWTKAVLVVDASIVANAVGFDGFAAVTSREIMAAHDIAAPDLMRVEAVSVLRRRSLVGHLTSDQSDTALASLLELDVPEFSAALLLTRTWELRSNLTTYDACYVALAEALRCPVATADKRLAAAAGPRCEFLVVEELPT